MSVMSSWDYNAKATFWRPTLNAFGEPSSYARTVRDCTFQVGGRQSVDDNGEEFIAETTYYLESATDSAPEAGDYVVQGDDASASPPASAKTVRSVRRYDPTTFNEGLPDYEVQT